MAMIDISGTAINPAQVCLIGPVSTQVDGSATVQFVLNGASASGGLSVVYAGTASACTTKRAEVVTAINAL